MTKVLFGIGLDMLFPELYKTTATKVTFLVFRVGDPPLKPPLFRGSIGSKNRFLAALLLFYSCFFQARNQLGTPWPAKSFLRGAKIF